MGSLNVFAANDDWLLVFDGVEASGGVTYGTAGVSPVDRVASFPRGADIPNRGQAMARASVECPYYLASVNSAGLRTRAVTAVDGVRRFYVDQRENPQTIEVCMGGQWEDGILISGRVATASDASQSLALFRRFERELRGHFVRVRAYLVGPEANRRLAAGWRLTTAAHSPRTYDLAPDSRGS
jgi:hypothetical protein